MTRDCVSGRAGKKGLHLQGSKPNLDKELAQVPMSRPRILFPLSDLIFLSFHADCPVNFSLVMPDSVP